MDIAYSETGALAGETTRSKGRDTALVSELRQGIGLIHELAQLAGAEELLDRRHQRLRVHQLSRSEGIGLTNGHPLLDDSLQAVQAHTHLVLKQLAHRAHPSVAEVVNVVKAGTTDVQLKIDQVIQG